MNRISYGKTDVRREMHEDWKIPALRPEKGTSAIAFERHLSPGKIYLDFYEISGII